MPAPAVPSAVADSNQSDSTAIISRRLRIASYNIQAGIDTGRFRHYLLHSWKHLLPDSRRINNLGRIADVLHDFDIVGLQEVDGGSLRSGFVDQTRYLAQQARFAWWYRQTNRRMGKISQHSNALLSRFQPDAISDHRLPGLPGRGALVVRYGRGESALHVCVLHLALGRRTRLRQVDFIAELLGDYRHVIVMGDMNCEYCSDEIDRLIRRAGLQGPEAGLPTFPSWRPSRPIDHILVSSGFTIENTRVLDCPFSDHLPITMDLSLPEQLRIAA